VRAATPEPEISSADRLGVSLFFAAVVHAVVILGVSFSPHEDPAAQTRTLDVILVQHESREAPEEADYLAQANQDGGGERAEKARPATPVAAPFTGPEPALVAASPPVPERPRVAMQPAPPSPRPGPEAAPAPPPPAPAPVLAQREEPAPQKVAAAAPPSPEPDAPPERAAEPAPPPEPTERPQAQPAPEPESRRERAEPATRPQPTQTLDGATLVSRSLAMASLSAEIDRKMEAYAKRPRRKWINARTHEYKYASYMEAWRQKVERIGNLNYPDEARRRRLSGNLLLDVAIGADGSLEDITLRRSSGHKVLDDAAIRIVKLAAPFSPLPDSIRNEVDILHIERTWQFLSSNRLASR